MRGEEVNVYGGGETGRISASHRGVAASHQYWHVFWVVGHNGL